MSASVDEERERSRRRKLPRKLSLRYLQNAALHYLKRYSSTQKQLERVLTRRVDRSLRFHGGDRAEALAWRDAVIEKLARTGYVNDAAYAESKARSLRAGGRSSRAITVKLREKGIASDLVAQKLARASLEVGEEEAAPIWARKKRLGPHRPDPTVRLARRMKDLASLARAGFSYATARRVIDEGLER